LKITHVIYDFDGLLLNTEPFYTEAARIILERYGKSFDWSLKSRMVGRRALESARLLTREMKLPISPEAYLEMRKPLLDELFAAAEPMPGSVRLTRTLHECGIPQAVATSSERRSFDLKASRHREWLALFDCIVVGDEPELRHGKPAPDIFLIAAARMRVEPGRCLVFEDAPVGVQAARAAGMHVVAVPDPMMSRGDFAAADLVLDSLLEFDGKPWGLPVTPERRLDS